MLRRWLLALVVLSLAPLGLSLSSVAGSSGLGPTRYIVVLNQSADAGAVAGRPFAVQFQNRKRPPQPAEKRAWLTPKIL